jgi:hypothetical protein
MPRSADRLVAMYERVERQLEDLFRLARGTQNRVDIERVLRRLRRDLATMGARTERWAGDNVGGEFRVGSEAAERTLGAAGRGSNLPLTQLETQSLAALEGRISSDLSFVRDAISRSLVLGNRFEGFDAVIAALDADGVVRMGRDGPMVQTPSGRFWRVGRYAEMLGRTAVAEARRESFRTRYLSNGVDVVRVIANGTLHDVCRAWEGELLSLTGATPNLPTVDDARAAGLFHPNCQHRYVVAIGVDVEQPPLPVGFPTIPAPSIPLPILGRNSDLIPRTPRSARTGR